MSPDEDAILRALLSLPAEGLVRVLRQLPRDQLREAVDQLISPAAHSHSTQDDMPAKTEDPRRSAPRQRVLRGAKIIYNNRLSVADAQVRNLSENGCRLRVPASSLLPSTFEIRINGIDGERLCEVRWRKDTELGVLFLN